MNCEQGDLAVAVYTPAQRFNHVIGRIVEVLYLAPEGSFDMPNGVSHNPVAIQKNGAYWVCRFVNPIKAPFSGGRLVDVEFAPVPDAFLRPIRDSDGEDEMPRIAGLPNKQPEVA